MRVGGWPEPAVGAVDYLKVWLVGIRPAELPFSRVAIADDVI